MKKQEIVVEDVAASFQEAVVEVLATKAVHAAEEKGYKTIALSGGVAANSALRDKIPKHRIMYRQCSYDRLCRIP